VIDDKDALFIKLQYPDFCKEMVEYASQFIHWDQVPHGQNGYGSMLNFCRKYYSNCNDNTCWSYMHTNKYKPKYPIK
jgi:hypothetical protein